MTTDAAAPQRSAHGKALLIGVIALGMLLILGVAIGPTSISIGDVINAIVGNGDTADVSIVREVRGPRVLLAALIGAGLSVSGGALQGTLRNPLAEPFLLGVSGGAAVGAVTAMVFGATHPLAVTLAAFAGAALATVTVSLVARVVAGRTDARMLLMAGVVVGAFANAVIMVALAGAPAAELRGVLWWMMGSVSNATWGDVARLTVAVLVFGGALLWLARELDVLALGEEPAAALGANVDRSSRQIFLLASFLAAATVAAAGLVGFVGLVVPNIARALGARRHRPLLLVSAVYGAALLVFADLVARTARSPQQLPLGAITALIGVPFFLAQLRKLH
ncbi:MAG: iron ABC transporter permease [Phycisphaerae bacterium]|nr:iron ABC transporter permease [Gemmatimonadaceae bacterium]